MDYRDIHVGAVFSFEKTLSRADAVKFADLTGDFNRLHVDEEFGKTSKFGRNVVHGMLCGSLFSQIVGMHCPGENSLYITQSLHFRSPVFYGDVITVRGTVVSKNDSIKMITLKTEILKDAKVTLDGEARVKILE